MKHVVTKGVTVLLCGAMAALALPWGHRYAVEQPWQTTNVVVGSTLTVSVEWGEGGWDGATGSTFGYGASRDGSGWTWVECNWFQDGSGNNKRCKAPVTFNTTGTNWYAYRMIKAANGGTSYQHGSDAWSENTTVLYAVSYVLAQAGTAQLAANFSATPTAGSVPLTVNFSDTSSTGLFPIVARAWTFGDGGTSSALNPSHQYTAVGAYDVRLIVTDSSGAAATNLKSGYISVQSTNQPPPGAHRRPITIGRGPLLSADPWWDGSYYYEELLDWDAGDLRGLNPQGNYSISGHDNDGYYWSRDLVAAYSRFESNNFYVRADLFELGVGAENGYLDVYVLIDCASGGASGYPDSIPGTPAVAWDVALCVYDGAGNATVKNAAGTNLGTNNYLGQYFRSDLDGMECGVKQAALTGVGWDGTSPVRVEVITTKDMVALRGDSSGALWSTNTAGRAKYAAILHANQSLNKADGIGSHIHDENYGGGSLDVGFRRALETHQMFNFAANYHLSGTLLAAMQWAVTDKSTTEKQLQDGPTFLTWLKEFVDNDQNDGQPGALVGGVFAEHMMPYFEGPCNAMTIDRFTDVMSNYFGLTPRAVQVMHVPERVIRSTTTGMAPLDGRTFDEIAASDYPATYLDEVNHLHFWFYPSETPWAGFKPGESGIDTTIGEQAYQHKLHKINGVYCFMINDREDNSKFWVQDDGLRIDTRYTLLEKARSSDQGQITVIFDDWEAYGGRSFTDPQGNNNYTLWHKTARWLAMHPWVNVTTLKDALAQARSNESAWVVDHGTVVNKEPSTYEWLRHACKDHVSNPKQSYDNWYYGSSFNGGEQDFYSYVPNVIGTTPLPSGLKHGDLNTTNSLMALAWAAVQRMPAGRLKTLAEFSYAAMIYETAWHDEDQAAYQGSGYKPPWPSDDTSYDAISGWALQLQNHTRDVGVIADAAHWVTNVLSGGVGTNTLARQMDLDFDGEQEYVLANNLLYACFEKYGGRLIKAFALDWCPEVNRYDAREIVGSPVSNPSDATEAEREAGDGSFWRCSAFRDAGKVDTAYSVTAVARGFQFSAGGLTKTITLEHGRDTLNAAYTGTGTVYVRFGLAPNNLSLLMAGHDALRIDQDDGARFYGLINTNAGGRAYVTWCACAGRVPAPLNAGYLNRVLPLTEQVEVQSSSASFTLGLGASRDNDGIPDSYELANGLDPAADDGDAARLAYLLASGTLVPEPGCMWGMLLLWRWLRR
jgi:PKD repeat protein